MPTSKLLAVTRHCDAIYAVLGPVTARRLTLTRLRILLHICHASLSGTPSTATELARVAHELSDDVRAVAALMQRRRWLDVVPDDEDRRSKRLVLSAKGVELANRLTQCLETRSET